MSYQISSKTGFRHMVDADMPGNDAALAMWHGQNLPVTACGRRLEPVNFYEPDEPAGMRRYQCTRCFPAETKATS